MDIPLRNLLASVGIIPAGTGGGDGRLILGPSYIPVLIDGVVFGGMKAERAFDIVSQLRVLKISGGWGTDSRLDPTTELAYIPYDPLGRLGLGVLS